jgi:hypothetical protein
MVLATEYACTHAHTHICMHARTHAYACMHTALPCPLQMVEAAAVLTVEQMMQANEDIKAVVLTYFKTCDSLAVIRNALKALDAIPDSAFKRSSTQQQSHHGNSNLQCLLMCISRAVMCFRSFLLS